MLCLLFKRRGPLLFPVPSRHTAKLCLAPRTGKLPLETEIGTGCPYGSIEPWKAVVRPKGQPTAGMLVIGVTDGDHRRSEHADRLNQSGALIAIRHISKLSDALQAVMPFHFGAKKRIQLRSARCISPTPRLVLEHFSAKWIQFAVKECGITKKRVDSTQVETALRARLGIGRE